MLKFYLDPCRVITRLESNFEFLVHLRWKIYFIYAWTFGVSHELISQSLCFLKTQRSLLSFQGTDINLSVVCSTWRRITKYIYKIYISTWIWRAMPVHISNLISFILTTTSFFRRTILLSKNKRSKVKERDTSQR